MKRQEKIFAVQDLQAALKEARLFVLIDYQGLTVPQISELRRLVRKAGGELKVVKNTLLERAIENQEIKEVLTGPTAIAIANEDELSLIKAIFNFSQETGLPSFKSGLLEDRVLAKEELEQLGRLPGREELLRKMLGLVQSPLFQLKAILSGNNKKLILILKSVKGGQQN